MMAMLLASILVGVLVFAAVFRRRDFDHPTPQEDANRRELQRLLYVERIAGRALRDILNGTSDPHAESIARVAYTKLYGEVSRVLARVK